MGLTTVDQFISEMGFVATQMLIKLINGESLDDQTYKMQTQLVIRSSCQEIHGKSIARRWIKSVDAIVLKISNWKGGESNISCAEINCRPSLRP